MASMAMTASFIPATASKLTSTFGSRSSSRSLPVVKAAAGDNSGMEFKTEQEKTNTMRRDVIFAAAAAAAVAACSLGAVATAEGEPARGSDAARKKYAQICVTMPTAKICHK